MEKYILELDLYKNFKCASENCLLTCCSSWSIDIDEKTLERYKKLDKKFNGSLLENISANNKTIYLHKEYCPFLTSNQLCKIQLQFGHESLCKTCQIYPKTEHIYKNIITKARLISCPEVLKQINKENYFCNKILTIEQTNEKETKEDKIENLLFLSFYEKLKYLSNLKISTKKMVNAFFTFSKDFDNFFASAPKNEIVKSFNNTFNKQYFKNILKNKVLKKDYTQFFNFNEKIIFLAKTLETKNFMFSNYIEEYKNLNVTEEHFTKYYSSFKKKLNKVVKTKQLFLYLLFVTLTDSFATKAFENRVKLAITFISYVNILCFSSFLQDDLRIYNNFLKIISNIFRVIFHGKFARNLDRSFNIPFFINTNFFESMISFL